jgi:uncharacterized membrane protein
MIRFTSSLIVCAIGAVIYTLPRKRQDGLVFGVPVPKSSATTHSIRRAVLSFRLWTMSVVSAVVAALFLVPDNLIAPTIVVGPILVLLTAGLAFLNGNRRAIRLANTTPIQRHVEMSNAADQLPWFAWWTVGPFAILSAAAYYLYANWAKIPEQTPVHWGLDGQPNGWMSRSVHGVDGPLIFGAELCAALLFVGFAIWFGARRSRLRRLTLAMLVESAYMISLIFAIVATSSLLHLPTALLIVGLVAFIASIIWLIARNSASTSSAEEVEPTPLHSWSGGMLYYNHDDSALFVEKRAGFGYTINFANRWSWVLILIFVAVIASAPILL